MGENRGRSCHQDGASGPASSWSFCTEGDPGAEERIGVSWEARCSVGLVVSVSQDSGDSLVGRRCQGCRQVRASKLAG